MRQEQAYAGFFVRLAAYLIDWLIISTALLFVRVPVLISGMMGGNILTKDFIFKYSVTDIACYLAGAAYFILMTYYTGSTLGKKLFQLKVVSADADRDKPSLWEIFYRETVGKFISKVVLYVGYIMVMVQQEKRGIHDLLSDTCVVYDHAPAVKNRMGSQPEGQAQASQPVQTGAMPQAEAQPGSPQPQAVVPSQKQPSPQQPIQTTQSQPQQPNTWQSDKNMGYYDRMRMKNNNDQD